ncbi:MAG: FtsX-like permease family protein [Candidatus Eisenbacteria bacterium]|nr:FtsX-like permease family protein [Candidatus Eisenbacteria bacterium]
MKFLHLISVNLRRKKLRTLLTAGSFMVALLLYGLLMTIKVALSGGVDVAGADRLVVLNRVSLIMPLPISYKEQIQRIPHVADLTFATWFGGYYQDMKNFFPNYAVDPESYPRVYSEYLLSEEELAAFRADRQGCIVSPPLAERFGFKVGDRIPLEGTIWQGTWELNARGIYEVSRGEMLTSEMWFQYDYMEERRQFFKGTVGWYVVKVDDPANAMEVATAIDTRFRNSPFETKTDTEKAFAAGFANQIGNIRLLILSIGSVVFFTLLLVTGNSVAISVRERTGELAVMKTVGFSDASILTLVMAESLVVSAVGGGIGLLLAKFFTLGGDPTGGMLPYFYLPGRSMLAGFGVALAAGAGAGIIPAVGAMRLKIVDALRRV